MFKIDKIDRNLSEMLRISSFIVTDICERQFMMEATSIPLSQNHYYILKMLDSTEPFNLSKMAKILSVSNAAIGKNIDKLVQYKLVTRRFTKTDRRSAKIAITQKGQDILQKYQQLKIEKQVEIFKRFSKADKKKFTDYLRSFVQNTLHEDMDTDILCLQCNGFCGENCVVKQKMGTCIRKH